MVKVVIFKLLLIILCCSPKSSFCARIPEQCKPPVIENGVIRTSVPYGGSYASKQRIRIKCDDGYEMFGRNPTCQVDGTWTSLPICSKTAQGETNNGCRNPFISRSRSRVSPRKSRYSVGDEITIKCEPGKVPANRSAKYTCGENGKFAEGTPLCISVFCTLREKSDHLIVRREKLIYSYTERIKYSCQEGYELDSSKESSTCQDDGSFYPRLPECRKVYCKKPKFDSEIRFYPVQDQYEVFDFIVVKCADGRIENRPVVMKCTTSGKFSGNAPVCYSAPATTTCGLPSAPTNGRIIATSDTYRVGYTISVECEPGFTIDGPRTLACQKDGSFYPLMPKCRKIRQCYPPFIPRNARILFETKEYSIGHKIIYSCDSGYILVGDSESYCGKDGFFSPRAPTCERSTKLCDAPKGIKNGFYQPVLRENPVGTTIAYSCSEGYVLAGSSTISCRSNGQYSDEPPKCLDANARTCRDPGKISNGRADVYRLYHKIFQKISYRCNENYHLVGIATITCLPSGHFSEEKPKCERICRLPRELPSGVKIKTSRDIHLKGDAISYYCTKNKNIIGADSATCGKNGFFSKIPKSCGEKEHSCRFGCGFKSGASCQCDYFCSFYSNCCSDRKKHCGAAFSLFGKR